MSGFVATPPAPASPTASKVDLGAGFWPSIDINQARAALRLGDGAVTHERLASALEGAVIAVLDQLAGWQALQTAATLAEVDEIKINGEPVCALLWTRAVRHFAAAEIIDAHADVSATNEGVQRAEDKRTAADDHRRIATEAVRRLMARGVTDPDAPGAAGGILVDLV